MYERMGFVAARLEAHADAERGDLVAPSARATRRLEPIEVEPRVARAVQAPNGVTDRLAHALDLVLAALVQRQLDAARAEAPRARRQP